MNSILINWKYISRGIPKSRSVGNDRAPTIEEIQKLVEYPDRRIKPLVYTLCSSGVRLGAWDYLQWKHIIPIDNNNGNSSNGIAKIIVYAGEPEEYYSFITPEAYNAIKEWMDFRASYGEKITGESWVMRDLFPTSNVSHTKITGRLGLATNPKKLKIEAIQKLISRAAWEQNLRQPLTNGKRRYEWKTVHGFRKVFKSRAEQVMKPINVELLMGHDIGISRSYYKPTEVELLEDYKKAVKLLTINDETTKSADLQNKVEELTEKTEEQKYVIEAKLAEKEKQIQEMKLKVDAMGRAMETFEQVITSKEEYANLLLHDDKMREIAKEVKKEMEQEEKYEEELEREAAELQDGEFDPVVSPMQEEVEGVNN